MTNWPNGMTLFDAARAELGVAVVDNRRLKLCEGIDAALRKGAPLSVVVYGNLASEIDEVRFPNGHTYRPWPGPRFHSGPMMPEEWTQLVSGVYEWHADLALDHDATESPGDLLIRLERAISAEVASMSLVFGASLRWYAASLQGTDAAATRQPRVSRLGTVATRDALEPLESFWNALATMHDDDRAALLASLEWHRLGNDTSALLPSFLCHWIAVERHAHWWCGRFGLAKSEESILADLGTIGGIEIRDDGIFVPREPHNWQSAFGRLASLRETLNVSARAKITLAFNHLFGADVAKPLLTKLLTKHGDASLMDLRNNIAHGNIDEASVLKRFDIEAAIYTVGRVGSDFIGNSAYRLAVERR